MFGFYCVKATRFEAYTYVILCRAVVSTWRDMFVQYLPLFDFLDTESTFYNCTMLYVSMLNTLMNAIILLE